MALRLRGVRHAYGGGGEPQQMVLHGIDLDIATTAMTAVIGPSGSGKSTLLHCATGLDVPSSGSVHLGDLALSELSEQRRTVIRRDRIGFVFQAFNLLPSLTVEENLSLPFRLADREHDPDRLSEVLAQVGLAGYNDRLATQLSGGQQQRVAVARALVARPAILVADEPTGSLDRVAGLQILTLLREAVDRSRQTVLLVTHDPTAAAMADRIVVLVDGQVVDDVAGPREPDAVLEMMSPMVQSL